LGQIGVFDYFDVRFRTQQREVELEINSQYPGT
jgi:hypothetical protein